MFAFAIRRICEPDCRGRFTPRRPVIANIRPQATRLRLPVARYQHRNRNIVAMQFLRAQHIALQRFHQRPQRSACAAHPVGHRRTIEFDAFACIDLRLPVERKVIGILRHQHMRQQPGAARPVDRTIRRRLLHNARAAGATQLRPHHADDFEASRYVFQHLGDIFAQQAELPPQSGQASCFGAIVSVSRGSSAGSGRRAGFLAASRSRRCSPVAREAVRPRPDSFRGLRTGVRAARCRAHLLRALAEVHALELENQQFQVLDLGLARSVRSVWQVRAL